MVRLGASAVRSSAVEIESTDALPYRSRYAQIGKYRMHFLDEGRGPVVVLLHGNPTWCFFYRELIEKLRPYFRVIAPDHIGCGFSERPPGARLRASDRAEHLSELLRAMGIDRYSLVMHDWGGPIGTALALRSPQAVQSLVYLNTTLTETKSLPWFIKCCALPVIGPLLTQYTPFFVSLTTRFGVSTRLPDGVRQRYHLPYSSASKRAAIRDFVQDIPFSSEHPTAPAMAGVAAGIARLSTVPVKIIWGMRDPCFHKGVLETLLRAYPAAEVVRIADASHLVLEDAPEVVTQEIELFLRRGEKQAASGLAPAGPKTVPSGDLNALYRSFSDAARLMPDVPAAIIPDADNPKRAVEVSFSSLRDRIYRYEHGLSEAGLRCGDKALMFVPPGIEFLALAYAIMGRGAVPVFVDPGMGSKNIIRCIEDAGPAAFIAVPKAHLLRLLKKRLFSKLRVCVFAAERTPFPGLALSALRKSPAKPLRAVSVSADEPALIAFTSGGTGTPKGVVYTNQMLEAQLSIFRDRFGIEPGRKDLPLLPVFSLFGCALGASTVFPPLDPSRPLSADAQSLTDIIAAYEVRTSFGSPTLWSKIASYCAQKRIVLNSMEKIFIAGAPVSRRIMQCVRAAAPRAEVFTPYGATEALPVTLAESAQVLDQEGVGASSGEQGTPVGPPVPGVEVRIIKAAPGPVQRLSEAEILPPFAIGEIIVSGKNVSPRYLNRDKETQAAKIGDGERLWHRMGDMGYLDGRGRLFFCGRKAHAVSSGGRVWYSVPVENVFNQHPRVRRSALIAYHGVPAVVIEPEPGEFPRTAAARMQFASELRHLACASKVSKDISDFFFHCAFPVDARHNAKIFRDQLAGWASSRQPVCAAEGGAEQ